MTIRQELKHDHGAIEQLVKQLGNAVDTSDFPTIQGCVQAVDREVRKHIEAEERFLLPKLAKDHPDEVKTVRDQHAAITKGLDRLCMDAELHTLRKERVDEFIGALRNHVNEEESWLYARADDSLSTDERGGLVRFLAEHLPGRRQDAGATRPPAT